LGGKGIASDGVAQFAPQIRLDPNPSREVAQPLYPNLVADIGAGSYVSQGQEDPQLAAVVGEIHGLTPSLEAAFSLAWRQAAVAAQQPVSCTQLTLQTKAEG